MTMYIGFPLVNYEISRNSAKCDFCHQEVSSYVWNQRSVCECGNVRVTGGRTFIFHTASYPNNYRNTSVIRRVNRHVRRRLYFGGCST